MPPTILTIFGATGDLAVYKLIPTLIHMHADGLLPEDFRLVAVGRRDLTVTMLLNMVKEKAEEPVTAKQVKDFASRVIYFKGDFDTPESFAPLAQVLEDHMIAGKSAKRGTAHVCYNRLYYFATSPHYFATLARILKQAGLLVGCGEHERTIRVLVEKPFGSDLQSARQLNRTLGQFFSEEQIYRIDHYLGKETVQNIMVMRFANDLFEPLWNGTAIDHIQITVAESLGLGTRAGFYDHTGALKDFVQNHILQMLALLTMERPDSLSPKDIQERKLEILKALVPFSATTLQENVVRGQYAGKDKLPSYAEELGKRSSTETLVALKVKLRHPRYQHVPIYIRTGKRMPAKVTELSVHFKKHMNTLFIGATRSENVVSFRIQPDESVRMQVNNKIPGFGMQLHRGNLEFGYKAAFSNRLPSAYERLLLDFFQGDRRLFISSSEIEASWKFIDSITKNWQKLPLHKYPAGTFGPKAADDLIRRDGREWWTK